MDRNVVIAVALIALFFAFIWVKESFEEKSIGGERGEHGCLGPAGYSWDEAVGACTRSWEIVDESQRKAASIAADYVGRADGLSVVRIDVLRCPGCFKVYLTEGTKTLRVDLINWEPSLDVGVDSFDECEAAGYPVMESYPRQCRTDDGTAFTEEITEETEAMNQNLCEKAGGNWNTCSNKCRLDSQGKTGVFCTMQCEQLCECGGITGYGCPDGYECKTPGLPDALGYCRPYYKADAMSVGEALTIAGKSDCVKEGALKGEQAYNPSSRTWWIDLDVDKPGCAPACVVSEESGTAVVNWRCTGAIPP